MHKIICIAGFGDDASMFDPLVQVGANGEAQFLPISLPGFGAPVPDQQSTSLESLATYLVNRASETGADCVLAHSVASIVASIAANRPGSPLSSVLSLEGNLTPEDAYFSGTAALYEAPAAFRSAFLDRLDAMAKEEPVLDRYRRIVEKANPQALWELGCDADNFSREQSPGELLQSVKNAAYLYNPENVPKRSLDWLEANALSRFELPGASHWASVDKPQLLAQKISEILYGWVR